MKQIFFIYLIFFSSITGYSQSETIQELKDSNCVQLGFYFTPSTLRMLNFQQDPAFNELIKGVERMNFFVMKPDKFTPTTYFETADKLMTEENYEEYIIWDGDGDELQIFGKPKTKEMVGLAKYQEKMFIFNLKGTLDLRKIPDIYEQVINQDSTSLNGFSIIKDMLQDNERDIQQREKWRRERAERDRKRDSIEAAIKVDSNAVIIIIS